MDGGKVERMAAVIAYVEAHLEAEMDLDRIAQAAGYSKYHLHRMFTRTAGIPLHEYIRRRRLTEGARRLVYSEQPVMEIALAAGYQSQQAFASAFRSMYKKTPLQYRRDGRFYPLQLEISPLRSLPGGAEEISFAGPEDIPGWMNFAALVVDGFPCFDEALHLERIRGYVRRKQALLMRAGTEIVGAAAFTGQAGSIDFLAVHPQLRRDGAAGVLLDYMTRGLLAGRAVSITTFRAGDRADTGQRAEYQRLGFVEAELLTEFGYPTQRMILPPGGRGDGHG